MSEFDKGVDYYLIGKAEIKVGFPNGKCICLFCPHKTKYHETYHCNFTNNMLYSLNTRDSECVLDFSGEYKQNEKVKTDFKENK